MHITDSITFDTYYSDMIHTQNEVFQGFALKCDTYLSCPRTKCLNFGNISNLNKHDWLASNGFLLVVIIVTSNKNHFTSAWISFPNMGKLPSLLSNTK